MKREMKFRAKRLDNKEWIAGNLVGTSHQAVIIKITEDENGYPIDEETVEVDPATIGQFTGLTDAAGSQIYEGDIVSTRPRGFLSWHEGGFWTMHNPDTDCRSCYVERIYKSAKVIGNIHDNPELVEK